MDTNNSNPNTPKLGILLIGSGVIGSVYGAHFSLAGHNLWVLAHSAREAELAKNGIQVRNVSANETKIAKVAVASRADEREYDLVIVAVQLDQLTSIFPALRMLKGRPHVLFLGNNPDGHKALPADLAGSMQLGFPGIGGRYNGAVIEYTHIARQPTTLELVDSKIARQVEAVLAAQNFPVRHTADMNGWLAYHAVFISCISAALLRAGGNPTMLGHDRALLKHMCRAIEEGFRMLRAQGIQGAPRNLLFLHAPMLRPGAVYYWGSLMRSPKAELYFAAHTRHASDEGRMLVKWVLFRAKTAKPATDHLRNLLRLRPV